MSLFKFVYKKIFLLTKRLRFPNFLFSPCHDRCWGSFYNSGYNVFIFSREMLIDSRCAVLKDKSQYYKTHPLPPDENSLYTPVPTISICHYFSEGKRNQFYYVNIANSKIYIKFAIQLQCDYG